MGNVIALGERKVLRLAVMSAFGTRGTFLVIGAFQIAVIALLLPIDPDQNRRELGDGEST